jgi:tetratricopeptide (TPR) repeat protein
LAYVAAAALGAVLLVASLGTRARNQVWSSEETVWQDATRKDPNNWRAWTNYGRAFFVQADYQAALTNWLRAAALDPDNPLCHTNLARVYLQLNRGDLAEKEFQRLLGMNLPAPGIYIVYADWLKKAGRGAESLHLLEGGAQVYPGSTEIEGAIQVYFLEHSR